MLIFLLFLLIHLLNLSHSQLIKAVHCDGKPDNILIMPDRRVVVSDFGICVSNIAGGHPSRMRAGGVGGTPPYAAPECYPPLNTPHDTTDIWSLGVMLLEFIGGKRCSEDLADWPSFSLSPIPVFFTKNWGDNEDIRLLCFHCLERDPEVRLLNMLQFLPCNQYKCKKPNASPAPIQLFLSHLVSHFSVRENDFLLSPEDFYCSRTNLTFNSYNFFIFYMSCAYTSYCCDEVYWCCHCSWL